MICHLKSSVSVGLFFLTPALAMADNFRLEITDIGKRDYYCTVTATLENGSDETLQDLNGYFLSFMDGEKVGRSKGASFLFVAPGASARAEFETPGAPCTEHSTEVTSYQFIVGACRMGNKFLDQSDCASTVKAVAPIVAVTGP